MGPSIHEPAAGLQISGAGSTKWQSSSRKMYASGKSGGINTGDAGILEIWIGIGDSVLGEDERCWTGTEMEQSDLEILVKDNL